MYMYKLFIKIKAPVPRVQMSLTNKEIYLLYAFTHVTVFSSYFCQESQQRIVVMKKESERLSQEVNQSDTNKLGKFV